SSWLWGHEKTIFEREPGHAFNEWTRNLGLTYRIKAAFWAPDVLVLSDPAGIGHILQDKIYDYHHSAVVRPRVARLLGKGLGWVEGEAEHRRMRRLVAPSLSSENIKAMAPDIRDAASRAVNDLVSEIQTLGDESVLNILQWTAKATLNVIGRVAFLYDFDGGKSEEAHRILNARRQGVSPIVKYAGFTGGKASFPHYFQTLMLLRRFPFLNDLPISSIQAQGIAKLTVQSGVAQEMVRRNKDLLHQSQGSYKDLLSRLLSAYAEGAMSHEELFEQISTFVISGHETTTHTLAFTIWQLARHPNVQARLRRELDTVSEEPSYEDFQSRLPYLDAVLKETLRLFPGLPYMERVATTPDVIPLREAVKLSDGRTVTEIPIETGQTVLIPIIAIHRQEAVWDSAEEFRPERWLMGLPPKEKLVAGWSHTLAFSDGPRNCIGFRLGQSVILTSLMRKFTFSNTGAQVSLKISSSLQPWVVGSEDDGPSLPVHVHLT
ncbi:cytochrome P450, partial [Roridomyces roridus]